MDLLHDFFGVLALISKLSDSGLLISQNPALAEEFYQANRLPMTSP